MEEHEALLREEVAINVWGFPVLHAWLTLEDAKGYPKWTEQVKECYEQADQLITLIQAQDNKDFGNWLRHHPNFPYGKEFEKDIITLEAGKRPEGMK